MLRNNVQDITDVVTYWVLNVHPIGLSYNSKASYISYNAQIDPKCHNLINIDVKTNYYHVVDLGNVVTSYLILDTYDVAKSQMFMSFATRVGHYTGLHITLPNIYMQHFTETKCSIDISVALTSLHMYKMGSLSTRVTLDEQAKPGYNEWRMCWNSRCYMLRDYTSIPQESTWLEAEQFCESHQGHLLTLKSNTQQLALLEWLATKRRQIKGQLSGYSSIHLRGVMIFLGLRHTMVSYVYML